MSNPTPAKRPRHLMDPNNPVRTSNDASLTQVQRWVMSVLVVTTMFHLVVGLVVAAAYVDEQGGKIGLLVISAVFGVLGMAGAFAIHKKSPLTPWLLLGFVPTIIGAVWVLR
jgi:hypothetical protein